MQVVTIRVLADTQEDAELIRAHAVLSAEDEGGIVFEDFHMPASKEDVARTKEAYAGQEHLEAIKQWERSK